MSSPDTVHFFSVSILTVVYSFSVQTGIPPGVPTETPLFAGRGVAALASDPGIMAKTGKVRLGKYAQLHHKKIMLVVLDGCPAGAANIATTSPGGGCTVCCRMHLRGCDTSTGWFALGWYIETRSMCSTNQNERTLSVQFYCGRVNALV